jgi:uncharacterized membrane protein required for colicin V production
VQAVGLGFLDRLGGGALGLAEGVVVVALALAVGSALAGADHPALVESRAFAAYQEARHAIAGETAAAPTPHVAAPARAS